MENVRYYTFRAAMDCDVNALWAFAMDIIAPTAEVGVAN